MLKTRRITEMASLALIIAAVIAFWNAASPVNAQGNDLRPNDVTITECSPNPYVSASDGDRFASTQGYGPAIGMELSASNEKDCVPTRYIAAVDGDRFATPQVAILSIENGQFGPTAQNCFSNRFHAATDCDRLASALVWIPATGTASYGPMLNACFTNRFHAASDCDRLAFDLPGSESSQPLP